MLDVRRDDLVLRGETEAGEDDVAGVGRRADEGEVLRADLEQAREPLAGLLAQRQDRLEVLLAAPPVLEIAPVPLLDRLDGGPGQRPVRARVQVREPFEDWELGAGFLEGHLSRASTGVWSERMRPSTWRRSRGQRSSDSTIAPRTMIWSIPSPTGAVNPHCSPLSSAWVAERAAG